MGRNRWSLQEVTDQALGGVGIGLKSTGVHYGARTVRQGRREREVRRVSSEGRGGRWCGGSVSKEGERAPRRQVAWRSEE